VTPLIKPCENGSHEVVNTNASVVAVGVSGDTSKTRIGAFSEWVSNETVTGLEADLRLEGVLSNGTNHLEGNIWAIEQTCVIR